MIFERIDTAPNNLLNYSRLMKICFPHTNKFNTRYLHWLYQENPEGKVLGFNAWYQGQLVAHYACIPKRINLNGESVKALISLNTATHIDHQGKGLFTRLANMTYDLASTQGYCAVFGVSNANSTPGFIKKLGFQLVQPLETRLGFGPLNINFPEHKRNTQFISDWNEQALSWRCANPNNPVFQREQSSNVLFHAKAIGPIPVYAELATPEQALVDKKWAYASLRPARLFIGLVPEGTCSFRHYYPIPKRLCPSPLNFIYRSLDNGINSLEKESTHFSFMDFDAY